MKKTKIKYILVIPIFLILSQLLRIWIFEFTDIHTASAELVQLKGKLIEVLNKSNGYSLDESSVVYYTVRSDKEEKMTGGIMKISLSERSTEMIKVKWSYDTNNNLEITKIDTLENE